MKLVNFCPQQEKTSSGQRCGRKKTCETEIRRKNTRENNENNETVGSYPPKKTKDSYGWIRYPLKIDAAGTSE